MFGYENEECCGVKGCWKQKLLSNILVTHKPITRKIKIQWMGNNASKLITHFPDCVGNLEPMYDVLIMKKLKQNF